MKSEEVLKAIQSVYGQNIVLNKDGKKKDLLIQKLKAMSKGKQDYSMVDVYELVDKKVGEVMEAVNRIESEQTKTRENVANINGRLMMVPMIISIAFNVFFFIMNYVLNRLK